MRIKAALPTFWLLILWTMLSLCTQDSERILSPDTEVPSIETESSDTIVVTQGDTLPVPEVQAFDNIEGDITDKIEIDSSGIDLEALGSYDLFFTVSDNSGNTDTLQLCVLVTDGSVSPERLQGKWLLSERYHDFQGDTYTSEETWEYNRSFDKLLYTNFIRISNDSIYHYVKDTSGISSFISTFSISGKSLY
ncbi:MAG: immunoglobulin-like domain-containing protein, partial [Chitinivibrionales bacterium]